MKNCFRPKDANTSHTRGEISHRNRSHKSADVFDLLSKHFASLDCTKRNNTRRSNSGKRDRPISVVWNQSTDHIRHRSLASYELNTDLRWSISGRIQKQRRRPVIKTLSLPNNVDYTTEDTDMISVTNHHNAYRRSKTPDPTAWQHSNLDWTTANSLDRRRKRESSESNFSNEEVIHSRRRSKSLTRPELDGTPWNGPAAFYIDKNGRARQLGVSPPIPPQWIKGEHESSADNVPQNDDINRKIQQEYIRESNCSPLSTTSRSNPKHKRVGSKEDDETSKRLIKAMKELKDIAEVARVIDKVDNEEWLMVFIGELGHMLRDLVRFGDMEENPIKKSTLLDVLLDMIRFLKERSGYKEHSRYSLALREGLTDDTIQENPAKYDTIKRLKKLSEKRDKREKEMEKWQKQLINLAGTLEKCLVVLEDKKTKTSSSSISLSPAKHFSSPPRSVYSDYSSGEHSHNTSNERRFKPTHKRAKSSSGVSSSSDNHSQNQQGNLWVRSPTPTRSSIKDDSWITSPRSSISNTSTNKSRLWPAYNIEFSLPNMHLDVPVTPVQFDDQESAPAANESIIDSFISQQSHEHPIVKKIIGHQTRKVTQSPPNERSFYNKKLYGSKDPSRASVFDKIQNFESNERPRSRSDGSKLSHLKRNKPETKVHENNKTQLPRSVSPGHNQDSTTNHVREFVYHVPSTRREVTKALPTIYRSKSVEPKSSHQRHYNNSFEMPMNAEPLRQQFLPSETKTDSAPRSKESVLDDLQDYMIGDSDDEDWENTDESRPSALEESVRPTHKQLVHNNIEPSTSSESESDFSQSPKPKPRSSADIKLEPTSVRPKQTSNLHQTTASPPPSSRKQNTRNNNLPIKISTRSTNTQCDLLASQSKNEKNALDQMKQLKRRVDILQGGLKDARAENSEKERKISVLEARLERTKKNVVYGETEKGALEEEIDRMRKESREGRRELREEITILKVRLEESEKKLERERLRSEKAENDASRLREELKRSRRELLKMKEERDMMEQQIQSLNSELMQERGNNRSIQEENNRLEVELSVAETTIIKLKKRTKDNRERVGDGNLKLHGRDEELEQARVSIGNLTTQNEKLSSENKRLLNALICEQMMSSDGAACFIEQVKYLDDELRLARECSELQAKEYEKEIGRLLAEKRKLENQSSEDQDLLNQEIDRLRDLLDAEAAKSKNLDQENKELRVQVESYLPTIQEGREEIDESIVPYYEATTLQSSSTNDQGSRTVEQGVQYDDVSYTKMKAFEFYSLEAQRNAKKLTERGRQLDEQLKQKRKELRDRRNARR